MRCRLFRPYMAAGFAAVAAAGAVGGGVSPASASPAKGPARVVAVPVAAAASPAAAGARQGTSPSTGERVPAGPFTAVIPAAGAGRSGPFVQLSFAGTRYASPSGAGAAPPPVLRKALPMYTLTVHGINAAGQPDNGDFVVVANVDNPKAFGESNRALGTFKNGTATFKVPAGTYWAVGAYNSGVGWGGGLDRARHGGAQMVVLPQFAVAADKTVTVDARKATSRLRLSTPLPATPENEQINVERISSGGQKFEVSVTAGNLAGGFYVNSVSHKPADGTLDSITGAQLFSPASAASPYQYYVIVKSPSGTIPPHPFRISAGSLATVHENLYAGARGVGAMTAFGFLPGKLGNVLDQGSPPQLRVPGKDTIYLSAVGGSAVWQSFYHQVYPFWGGQSGSPVIYRPGQIATVDWNAYPLHTAPNVNLLGAVAGNMIVSANRSGDKLTLDFMPFSDSVHGHLGRGYFLPPSDGTVSGRFQIRQNGTTIASGNALNSPGIPTGEFYHQVTLSPKPSVVSFTLTAKRTGAAFTLSTATATTWTWRSAHESGATVPHYWYCSFASNHDCAPQPLPILSYAVSGLALNGTTAPGAQSLTVTVGHLQLAAALKITKVTVQASVNDGKTWTSAAVTGSAGTYHARYTAPASHYVTLRVTAATTIGSQVSETITRAYATAP